MDPFNDSSLLSSSILSYHRGTYQTIQTNHSDHLSCAGAASILYNLMARTTHFGPWGSKVPVARLVLMNVHRVFSMRKSSTLINDNNKNSNNNNHHNNNNYNNRSIIDTNNDT